MAANLELNGFARAGGDGCGCGPAGSGATHRLGLRCSPSYYQSAIDTPVPISVNTPGAVGDVFTDLDVLNGFVGIEFLLVQVRGGPMKLCIDAGPAEVTSDVCTFPTGFAGGESMLLTVDNVTGSIPVVFEDTDQSQAQVLARINAAFALKSLATPRAVAVGANRIKISAITCGPESHITMVEWPSAIPFDTTPEASGNGMHIDVNGTFLNEFPAYPDAPTRVQISGQGSVSILAAGRTAV